MPNLINETAKALRKEAYENRKLLKELPQFQESAAKQTNRSLRDQNVLTRQQIGQAKFENDQLILSQSKSGKDLTTRAERKQYAKLAQANVKSPATQQITEEAITSTLDEAKGKVRKFFSKIFNTILSPFRAIINFFKKPFQKVFGKKTDAAKDGKETAAPETKGAKTSATTKQKAD